MAELGSVFSLYGNEGVQETSLVDIDMLDYAYVAECNDLNKLNGILTMLRSGKEGYYPDLVNFTEEKFVSLLQSKDKKRYFALMHEATVSEVSAAEEDICSWQRNQTSFDTKSKVRISKQLPPVRGSTIASVGSINENTNGISERPDNKFYSNLSSNQNLKLAELRTKLKVSNLTELSRKTKANMEKIKGNESFRLGENDSAVRCYSTSLALDDTVAAVWANRAMAYIRMELFDLAEQDCSVALELDGTYVKALSRRGLVRFKRGKYAMAALDFRASLLIDPDNQELLKLLRSTESKYLEVEGVALTTHTESSVHGNDENVCIQVIRVDDCVQLQLPLSLYETQVLECDQLNPYGDTMTVNSFVRIAVTFDSDSDCEEGEDEKSVADSVNTINTSLSEGFCRIVVEEVEQIEEPLIDETLSVTRSSSMEPPIDTRYNHDRYEVAQRALEFKESGNALLKAGETKEALIAYCASLQCDPLYLPALGNRAQTYLLLEAYEAAYDDCSAVLVQDPQNLKALYRRAIAAHAQGNVISALLDVKKLLSIDTNNAQAMKLCEKFEFNLSLMNAESSVTKIDFIDGCSVFREASCEKLKERAMGLLAEGRPAEVVALLQSLTTSDGAALVSSQYLLASDLTSLLHLLGTAHNLLGDHPSIISCCDVILSLDASNFRAFVRRGQAHKSLAMKSNIDVDIDHLLLSAKDAADALKIDPNSHLASVLLDEVRMELDHHSAENKLVRKESNITNTVANKRLHSDVLKESGNAAMASKDYAVAAKRYTDALSVDAENIGALNNRALSFLKLERFDDAISDCSHIIIQMGDTQSSIKALFRRAEAYRALSQITNRTTLQTPFELLTMAVADLNKLLILDPTNQTAVFKRASLLTDISHSKPAEKEDLVHPLTEITEGSSKKLIVHKTIKISQEVTSVKTSTSIRPTISTRHPVVNKIHVTNSLSGTVPDVPPKNSYELERVWRALKDRPVAFAQYLSIFKKSTFKRVVTEAISPEIISSILSSQHREFTSNLATRLSCLENLSEITSFSFMLYLLPDADLACLSEVMGELAVDAQDESAVQRLI